MELLVVVVLLLGCCFFCFFLGGNGENLHFSAFQTADSETVRRVLRLVAESRWMKKKGTTRAVHMLLHIQLVAECLVKNINSDNRSCVYILLNFQLFGRTRLELW